MKRLLPTVSIVQESLAGGIPLPAVAANSIAGAACAPSILWMGHFARKRAWFPGRWSLTVRVRRPAPVTGPLYFMGGDTPPAMEFAVTRPPYRTDDSWHNNWSHLLYPFPKSAGR
jgi:hypothetical protein